MNTQDPSIHSELIVRATLVGERAWASEILVSARVLTKTPLHEQNNQQSPKWASETRIGRPSPTRSAAADTGQATLDERAAVETRSGAL